MVQIYNPNVVGKHILIDVKNIQSDRLKTVEMINPFMDKVVEELKLNVVGKCLHQFKKDNAPMVLQWFIYYQKVIYLFIHL
jgi:S-adenosylmethionine/arginine decarboxylase-like enzyme